TQSFIRRCVRASCDLIQSTHRPLVHRKHNPAKFHTRSRHNSPTWASRSLRVHFSITRLRKNRSSSARVLRGKESCVTTQTYLDSRDRVAGQALAFRVNAVQGSTALQRT